MYLQFRVYITDNVYADIINHILNKGEDTQTRNSEVKRMYDLDQISFSMTPLISVRKTAWKNALREWEWFMSGSSNINDLHPAVHNWWKPWANESGIVLFNYSEQFRHFTHVDPGTGYVDMFDQIQYLIEGIKNHPYSRRNAITTWNTPEMCYKETPITNCHGTIIQAFVDKNNYLHLKTYQRSVDVIVGLPHNWIQYWAFLMWLAHRGGRKVGSLIWIGGDVHIYKQHFELADKIIKSASLVEDNLDLVYKPSSEEFRADDFSLSSEYKPILEERAEMVV